ncbi:hypothetical protein WDW86_17945 [Bdellovibrionota bacterium FG-2]
MTKTFSILLFVFSVCAQASNTPPRVSPPSSPQPSGSTLKLDAALGRVVNQCKFVSGKRHIWLFKQWHLAPAVDTHNLAKAIELPQQENQRAIFRQLDHWVKDKQMPMIIGEGCSGEILESTPMVFNGWGAPELRKNAMLPQYDDITTHIPLKLEVKYGSRVLTLCGDDDVLIKETSLAFSDARGSAGFLGRLVQHRMDPVKSKLYLDGVMEAFKLPPATTIEDAVEFLKSDLRRTIERIRKLLDKRNRKVIETLKKKETPEAAIVFGGLHAGGIKTLLEETGFNCTMVEPAGYPGGSGGDEESLLTRLDQILK